MADAFFSPELFLFLRQLKRHNDRAWFEKNRSRYEQHLLQPALSFIGSFAPLLARLSPHFIADPRPSRGSLFRIYRDTRFSSDKRPYKTHVGIHFSHQSGKDAHAPVFYLHLEPGRCFAAAGVWHPDQVALTKIRSAVVANADEWARLRKKVELEGDKLSRPPKGFDPNHRFIEDLKFKDFVSSLELDEKQICAEHFEREFFKACKSMLPLVEFTTKALGLKF